MRVNNSILLSYLDLFNNRVVNKMDDVICNVLNIGFKRTLEITTGFLRPSLIFSSLVSGQIARLKIGSSVLNSSGPQIGVERNPMDDKCISHSSIIERNSEKNLALHFQKPS